MSISLILLPVALALRVVMGKQNFESWIDSLQIKVATEFQDEKDLFITVRKAGYDAEQWGGTIKTHARGEEFFFFWEQIDGVWTAVFAKSDSKTDIKRFIRDLEQKTGRRIFKLDDDGQNVVMPTTKTFPTNFRDSELLMKALGDYGLTPVQAGDGAIACQAGNCQLTFRKAENQPFSVEVRNSPDVRQIFQHLNEINDGYCHSVQSRTYQNLTSRIAERGLVIEREEVLDDNSIVITLNIRN
jgi:hypothetical protein